MFEPSRIDVHQHVVPPRYASWLADKNLTAGGMPLPQRSAESAVGMMDQHGIRAGILSVSTPGVHLGNDREARDKARYVNEYAAERVKDRPDRFGFFATLTLPDVDGALEEAGYALDCLGAAGVILLANSRGRYLGDPAFDPLMDELHRRGAVVLVHPSHLPGLGLERVPPYLVDFLLDTTRAAVNLVRTGAMTRWPHLRIILSHAGGFVPYAAYRMAHTRVDGDPPVEQTLALLRKFYFDTALSASPSALPSLLAFAHPDRILFGTDWPYAPTSAVTYFSDQMRAHEGLSHDERAAIDHRNAARLFPGFAKVISALPVS